MVDIRVIGAPKDLDLEDLNEWVEQRERLTAPIVGVAPGENSAGETETAWSFDLDQDRLEKNFARLKAKVGGKTVVSGKDVLVCEGKAYVSNVLTPVFLVRQKA